MGALIYFAKRDGYLAMDDWILQPIWLSAGLVVNAAAALIWPYYFEMGFYVSLLLSVLLVYQLATGKRWGQRLDQWDEKVGAYSYPIYLLHWQTGLLVSVLLFGKPIHDTSPQGLANLLISTLCVVLASFVLLRWVDAPIQSVRHKIKVRAKTQT